jgi:hypothetical protein
MLFSSSLKDLKSHLSEFKIYKYYSLDVVVGNNFGGLRKSTVNLTDGLFRCTDLCLGYLSGFHHMTDSFLTIKKKTLQ